MRAAEGRARADTGHILARAGGENVLRAAVLYGANASGKSNLVRAFERARWQVLRGGSKNERLPYTPFRLDLECRQRPSRFEFVFAGDNILYSYGFTADAERIHAEWLFRGPEEGEEMLYEREFDADSEKYSFALGDALVSDPERRQFYKFLHQGTPPNQLLLREADERGASELDPVIRWFREKVAVVALDNKTFNWDGDFYRFCADFLDRAGTSIRDVFDHDASEGTLRLMNLATVLHSTKVFVIDDIDRNLHPLVSRLFVHRFLNEKRPNQIICTTHNASLLDMEELTHDAVWFTEKDNVRRSHLYSLSEFFPAQVEALKGRMQQGYIDGRFGGIPFVRRHG